jgi:hypothetical protein
MRVSRKGWEGDGEERGRGKMRFSRKGGTGMTSRSRLGRGKMRVSRNGGEGEEYDEDRVGKGR